MEVVVSINSTNPIFLRAMSARLNLLVDTIECGLQFIRACNADTVEEVYKELGLVQFIIAVAVDAALFALGELGVHQAVQNCEWNTSSRHSAYCCVSLAKIEAVNISITGVGIQRQGPLE